MFVPGKKNKDRKKGREPGEEADIEFVNGEKGGA